MFNFHDFIMKGLLDAVGHMADYQVILNAAGWNEKGVITEEDLAILDAAITEKNAPPADTDSIGPMMETSGEENIK